MLVEIQVNKTEKMVYAMDENYDTIAKFPCGADVVEGYNENGLPYTNVPDGVYDDSYVYVDIDGTESTDVVYGWAYINIDNRYRALHGGRNLEPYQDELKATYGCFRMYNADVLWLAYQFQASEKKGRKPVITVVS